MFGGGAMGPAPMRRTRAPMAQAAIPRRAGGHPGTRREPMVRQEPEERRGGRNRRTGSRFGDVGDDQKNGMDRLLASKFKLGADASAAAGPELVATRKVKVTGKWAPRS